MQRIVESTYHQQEAAGLSQQGPSSSSDTPSAAIYDEMLQDCRKKAGEATLDRLRKLCQRLSRPHADRHGGDGESEAMGEEETVIVSYHAALLGKAEGAANIYGG